MARSQDARGRPAAKHKNILPNTYVPMFTTKVVTQILGRLAKSSAVALVMLWPTLKNTQPRLPSKKGTSIVMSQAEFAKHVREKSKEMKHRKWTKSRVIDAIVHDFWSQGLNLLQLAQIDCQLIVDNPNAYLWISSTVKNAWGHEVAMSLDPRTFLDRLAAQLSRLFMSYIYVCTHPSFPLILIRIQVFDLAPTANKKTGPAQPHISSHRPYFLAVPMNSPHIIHTPGTDLVSETVLQVVESSLSRGPSEVLHLETSAHQKPVRSLNSMHILKGSSRFAHSLGAWATYADGEADISPLARHESHPSVLEANAQKESFENEEDRLRRLANIRFKGSANGELASEALFDHTRPLKKRRTGVEQEKNDSSARNPYASLAPISVAEYELQEPLNADDSETFPKNPVFSSVKITLLGTDVFAGMHELSVGSTNPETSFIDLETLPGWLTGEEGESCGVVRGGVFQKQ